MTFEETSENDEKQENQEEEIKNEELSFQIKANTKWKKLSNFIFHQDNKELRRSLRCINSQIYSDSQYPTKWGFRTKSIEILSKSILKKLLNNL